MHSAVLDGTECTSVVVGRWLSRVRLFATPWTAAHQASLSFTISQSLLRLTAIESVIPSILCHPLLLLPSIFPNTRVFSNESALCIRWPKPRNTYSIIIHPMPPISPRHNELYGACKLCQYLCISVTMLFIDTLCAGDGLNFTCISHSTS